MSKNCHKAKNVNLYQAGTRHHLKASEVNHTKPNGSQLVAEPIIYHKNVTQKHSIYSATWNRHHKVMEILQCSLVKLNLNHCGHYTRADTAAKTKESCRKTLSMSIL